jgi:hypothetical protein
MPYFPWYYSCISYISCTCWVPTISVLNLANFPLLLKPAAQKEKMDCNSLMRSSSLLVALVAQMESSAIPFRWESSVFKYIIYVIIILHSWLLVICEHFWSYVWSNWSWVMHTMSTWFWHKNRIWHNICATCLLQVNTIGLRLFHYCKRPACWLVMLDLSCNSFAIY